MEIPNSTIADASEHLAEFVPPDLADPVQPAPRAFYVKHMDTLMVVQDAVQSGRTNGSQHTVTPVANALRRSFPK